MITDVNQKSYPRDTWHEPNIVEYPIESSVNPSIHLIVLITPLGLHDQWDLGSVNTTICSTLDNHRRRATGMLVLH